MRFLILGPVEGQSAAGPLPPIAPRHKAVLGYLLLHAGRPVSIDRLTLAIWAAHPPQTAEAQIRASISAIRAALRDGGEPEILYTQPAGYALKIDRECLDLNVFQELTTGNTGDAASTARRLNEALKLWRGPALADVSAAYVGAARAMLEDERLTVFERLSEVELELGRHEELVAKLRLAVGENPLRERLSRQLMLALYRCGRQSEALEAARQFRAHLADEHGLDPGATFLALEHSILKTDPGLMIQPDDGSGEVPRQLPLDVTDFVGRDDALARLTAQLDSGSAVQIITGPPGVGKSALATRWAHEYASAFPDGQLYVNLQGFGPGEPAAPVAVLASFLRSIGVERPPSDVDEASALFRSLLAKRHMLVVLDNAASAAQVTKLIPGGAQCTTLITSRKSLGSLTTTVGARQLKLGMLTEAEAIKLLGRFAQPQRLMADRSAVQDLVQICAGLPLALRIVAADLADQPAVAIRAYVEELVGDPLLGLASADDDDVAVRRVFEHSYRRLTPGLQRLFRLIGHVPSPDISLQAVGALADCRLAEARALLQRLFTAHLLDRPATGRYAMHDLLRLYASELDAQTEKEPALDRYHRWHLDRTDAAARVLYPHLLRLDRPASTVDFAAPEALAWLDSERVNLLAIISRCADAGPAEVAWQLADDLRGYFTRNLSIVSWEAASRDGLRAARAAGDLAAQVVCLISMGAAERWSTSHTQSLSRYFEALKLADAAGWIKAEGVALGFIGVTYAQAGDLSSAATWILRSLDHNRRVGNLREVADDLAALGTIHLDLGLLDQAREHHVEAIAIFRKIGSTAQEASVLVEYADTCYHLGDLTQARQVLERALPLAREFGKQRSEIAALGCLSKVDLAEGKRHDAIAHAQQAVEIARETGHRMLEAISIGCLANATADPQRHAEGLTLATELGARQLQTDILISLAETQLHRGAPQLARDAAREALEMSTTHGYGLLERRARRVLAVAEEIGGQDVSG